MSDMSKKSNTLGILLFLLLISRSSGKLPALGQAVRFDRLIKDMRRMADMMDQIDGLSHFLPPPGAAENKIPDSGAALPAIPDLEQLAKMAGPLLSMLGDSHK